MFRSLLAASLLALALFAAPAVRAGESEDLTEIEALTGLNHIFDDMSGGLATGAQGVFADQRYLAAWQGALKEAFVPAAMRDEMFKVFPSALSDADRAALLDFYRSDFGRRISGLESDGASADPMTTTAAAQVAFAAASPERKALIDDLLKAVNSDAAKHMFVESLRSMVMAAVLASTKGNGAIPWDKINAQVDHMSPAMLEALDTEMQQRSLYIYRDLTDAEIRSYIDFLKGAPARKFYQLVIYGSAMVTDQAMTTLGTSFATRLRAIGA